MAFIDYGAVVFKNGICQNSGKFFMDMQESVGWSDASSKSVRDKTDGNFFAYAGDEALTVAVYKHYCRILVNKEVVTEIWGMSPYNSREKHISYRFSIGGTDFCLRQLGDHYSNVHWLKFTYRGDHYNVIYGYGIDPDIEVWNAVKVRYLGKNVSRKVDKLYRRLGWG